ncbi:MAG: hypothetical protein QXJ01_03635 [Candidatus Nezhaarchaeales archaeon]
MPRLGLLLRLRFLLPFLALFVILYSATLISEGGYGGLVVYDYAVWLAVFFVCLGAYLDLMVLRWRHEYSSTLLLSICGAIVIVLGRVLSLIFNQLALSPYKVIPLFGSPYTQEGFAVSLACSVFGSILTGGALMLHSILNKPLIISRKPLYELAVWRAVKEFNAKFWSHRWLYLVAAFLLGFAFRFGPEILWWPWLIGWDTVEYAAHLMDFMEKLNPFTSYHWMGSMRNCPPLLNILLYLPASAIGAWNTFKLYPSVAYGFLALSSALLANRVFRLDNFKSFFVSVVTTLFIINLRISWDYQRQLLGSIFMLLSIAILDSHSRLSTKAAILSSLLLVCCALSHEVTAFFSIALSVVLIFRSVRRRILAGAIAGTIGLASSVALEAWYWRGLYTPNIYFTVAPIGVVSYSLSAASEVIGYLVAGFGLTLPFAILAIIDKSSNTAFSKTGLVSLVAAGISPLLAPYTSVTTWYRFLAGSAPLVSSLAGSWIAKHVNDKRFHIFFVLLLLVVAIPYAYGFSDTSQYVSALREFPQGLVPSPTNERLLSDLKSLSKWFEEQNLRSTIIAAPEVAKWIHLAIRNPTPSDLIWAWQTPISSYSIKQLLRNLNLDKAYVVCSFNLEELEGIRIHKLREGIFQVYMVEAVEDLREH